MESYLLIFSTAFFGFFFLAMSLLCLDMLKDPYAFDIESTAYLLLLFLMATVSIGSFALSFYTLFFS